MDWHGQTVPTDQYDGPEERTPQIKPHTCGGCGKAFRSVAALRLHFEENHSGKDVDMIVDAGKYCDCKLCGAAFIPKPSQRDEFCTATCRNRQRKIKEATRKRRLKARKKLGLGKCVLCGSLEKQLGDRLCSKHRQRYTRHGNPWVYIMAAGSMGKVIIDERTLERVEKSQLPALNREWQEKWHKILSTGVDRK